MIWLFLVCLVLLVIVLQRRWAQWSLDQLEYTVSCDTLLAEPEQVLTLTSVIENHWFLPVLYIHLMEYLPGTAVLREDPAWIEEHAQITHREVRVEETTYLLPRRRQINTLHFTLPERGWYRLGGMTLEAGDFLGLKEAFRQEDARRVVVVIPRRCESPDVLRTLGGFLGDISVRRFILEDPVLTVGFREYTGREPMKALSWTQSARAGQLLVKQYDYTVDVTVTVLLNAEGGRRGQLEQCYSLARTVCETLEEKGIPYDFRTNGDLIGPMGPLPHVGEGLGRQHLNTILYGLGRANCRCVAPLERLVEQSLRSVRQNQSFLVISPPMDARQRLLTERLRVVAGAVTVLTGEDLSGEEAAS